MRTLLLLIVIIGQNLKLPAQEQIAESPSTYWIQFTDKEGTPYSIDSPLTFLTQRAIDRREKYGIAITRADLPVNPAYVDSLRAIGWQVQGVSRWFNGAICHSLDVNKDEEYLAATSALSFVMDSTCTDSFKRAYASYATPATGFPELILDTTLEDYYNYGPGERQIKIHNGQYLHNNGYRGQNMHIAVTDAGFLSFDQISAFDHLRESGRLLGVKDFGFPQSDVYQISDGDHGTTVASTMLAMDNYNFVGTAPEASYWLLRTEVGNTSDNRVEEYYWLMALEFADSVGADIINASLGYRNAFLMGRHNYEYPDMNGQSTIVAHAAEAASSRGMLIVCGAGNAAWHMWHYIISPADATNVLSVGAVDRNGDWADFSSTGPTYDGRVKPDVVAMGDDLIVIGTNGYPLSPLGTSFASPIMCGLVACYWQARPGLSNLQVMDAFRMAGDEYFAENRNYLRGYGLPDIYRASLYPALDSSLVGTNKTLGDQAIRLYPTPFSHALYIHLPEGIYQLRISDLSGRTLISRQLTGRGGRQSIEGCGQLSSGIYLLSLQSPTSFISRKIIKQ